MSNKQETGPQEALVYYWQNCQENDSLIEGFQSTFTIMRNETQDLLPCWRKIFCAWSPLQLIILSLFCLFKEKRKSNTDLTLCCLQKTGNLKWCKTEKTVASLTFGNFHCFFLFIDVKWLSSLNIYAQNSLSSHTFTISFANKGFPSHILIHIFIYRIFDLG